MYRVSHETWQLVNIFECRHLHTLYLILKAVCSLLRLNNVENFKTLMQQNIEYHNVEITRRRILKNFDCYKTLNDKEQRKMINLKISIFRWCILYAIQKGNNSLSNPYIFATQYVVDVYRYSKLWLG